MSVAFWRHTLLTHLFLIERLVYVAWFIIGIHLWYSLIKKLSIFEIVPEFFHQGDCERELGLPLSPLCDRSTTIISSAEIGFIRLALLLIINVPESLSCPVNFWFQNIRRFILRPTYDVLSELLPKAAEVCEFRNASARRISKYGLKNQLICGEGQSWLSVESQICSTELEQNFVHWMHREDRWAFVYSSQPLKRIMDRYEYASAGDLEFRMKLNHGFEFL